jgi:transposase
MQPSYEQLLIENELLKGLIARMDDHIKKLESRNKELEGRIADLEAQINQNSKNSSKAPSSDRKKNSSPLKDKKNRSYHPGANRQLLPKEAVTSKETRLTETCPRCSSTMNPTDKVVSWQQIELPVIKPLIHQIDLVTSKCSCCRLEIQPKLTDGEQFLLGPRLEAFVNLLMGQYRQGHRPVRTMIATILPGVLLSQGLISKIKARTAKALSEPYEELLGKVVSSERPVHADATGWRYKGINEQALVLRMDNIITYALVPRQNGETLAGLIGKKIHCLVSDRGLATSQIVIKIKQYCLAHLIRNIKGQAEHPGASIEDNQQLGVVYDTLQELFIDKHRFERGEIGKSTWKQYGYAKWSVIKECLEGLMVSGSTKKLRKFCSKLLGQIEYFRAYLKDETIPMTNNPAEEALRNLVIARKLCFGSRSIYGKRWRETLHSCLETLGRHGKSMLDFLAGAIQAARTGQPIPSVL